MLIKSFIHSFITQIVLYMTIQFESDGLIRNFWFEIFESATPAIVPQTMLTVQQKTSTIVPW